MQRKKWDTEDVEVSVLRGCENKADGSTTHTELLTVICYFQMERKKAMFDRTSSKARVAVNHAAALHRIKASPCGGPPSCQTSFPDQVGVWGHDKAEQTQVQINCVW